MKIEVPPAATTERDLSCVRQVEGDGTWRSQMAFPASYHSWNSGAWRFLPLEDLCGESTSCPFAEDATAPAAAEEEGSAVSSSSSSLSSSRALRAARARASSSSTTAACSASN